MDNVLRIEKVTVVLLEDKSVAYTRISVPTTGQYLIHTEEVKGHWKVLLDRLSFTGPVEVIST